MNLTLHLVAKDVRHLCRALVLWIGLLISQVAVSHRLVSISEDNFNWFQRMVNLQDLLVGLGWMVTYLLVGMLVLEDPVAGEKMFWVTRPINGGRLLTAKVITAALLFGALPLLVWAPWWLLCDFSFRDMGDATIGMMLLQLLFAISAFVVASFAANVGRFMLMSVLLAIGGCVALMNLIGPTETPYALLVTRVVMSIVVLGMTGVIGTIMMYRTRRIGRAIIVLLIGTSLAGFAGMKFPVKLPNPFLRRAETGPLENSSQIAVEIVSARLNRTPEQGSRDYYLALQVRVLNLPEERGLKWGRADVTLQWPDGTVVQSLSAPTSSVWNDDSPLYHAFGVAGRAGRPLMHWDTETAAREARIHEKIVEHLSRRKDLYPHNSRGPEPTRGRSIGLYEMIPVSEQIAERILKEPPQYHMKIKVQTSVPEVLGEIALVPGTVVARHSRVELLNVRQQPATASRWEKGMEWENGTFSVLQGPMQSEQISFCYIDRQHQNLELMNTNQTQPTLPITARISWVGFDFPVPQVWRTDRWIEVPGWQKDFRIGIVLFKSAGTFDRSLSGEHLTVIAPEKTEESIPATRDEPVSN